MGRLRPVDVSFKLDSNKVIAFSLLKSQKRRVLLAAEHEDYGYAADIAFLTLYANEISSITIPVISHTKLNDLSAWSDGVSSLKTSVNVWKEAVLPSIKSLPETMHFGLEDIQDLFDDVNEKAANIVDELKKSEDYNDNLEKFKLRLEKLEEKNGKVQQKLDRFFNMLTEHQNRLNEENTKLMALSKQTVSLTTEQQKQIDQIANEIDSYQSSRKAYIAGASVTGVIAGAAIGGGIAAIVLIPGVGVCIGIAAFFAAGILATGTGICTANAIELKKTIERLSQNKDKIEVEKEAIALIGKQFESLALQTSDLVDAVLDIKHNWDSVSTALDNIKNEVKKLDKKSKEETTIEKWEDIQSDLASLKAIVDSLKEGIDTMDVKTKIYSDCDLSDCKTQDEILKKLSEFVQKEAEKDKVS